MKTRGGQGKENRLGREGFWLPDSLGSPRCPAGRHSSEGPKIKDRVEKGLKSEKKIAVALGVGALWAGVFDEVT